MKPHDGVDGMTIIVPQSKYYGERSAATPCRSFRRRHDISPIRHDVASIRRLDLTF
jgi:hypothetical protein